MTEVTPSAVPGGRHRSGTQLRLLRRARRQTLKDVAERASVSESFLSQLERGRTGASIASLQGIAAALGVEVSDLFARNGQTGPSVLRSEDRGYVSWGTFGRKALLTPKPFEALEVVAASFEPGGSTGAEPYAHGDSEEMLLVVAGAVELTLGAETMHLRDGRLRPLSELDSASDRQCRRGDGGGHLHDQPAELLMSTTHDVELRGVTRRFGDVAAVDALDLAVVKGEFLSLLGPSGCGKTTTLRLIAGFERPDAGVVLIDGSDVSRLPPYRRPVNTVFQSYALFPHLSVLDNVAYGLKQRRIPRRDRRARAQEMLELVHLRDVGTRRPRELSGGQQQRVALARALVMSPKVLLLDEPLGRSTSRCARPADRAEADPGDGRDHVRLRDPRPGGGARDVRPRRGHEPRPDRAAGAAAGDLRPPGDRVRRRLHRRHELRRVARGPARGAARERPADAGGEGFGGTVVVRMVIGAAVQCVVRLDDGQEVLTRTQRSGDTVAESLAEGERVKVSWGRRCGPRPDGRELTMRRPRTAAASGWRNGR